MTTLTQGQEKNLDVARRINRETRANPNSLYAGKYIGVWHQQVVAVTDTLDELVDQLDALDDPDNEAVWVEASADYDTTYMIWEFRCGA